MRELVLVVARVTLVIKMVTLSARAWVWLVWPHTNERCHMCAGRGARTCPRLAVILRNGGSANCGHQCCIALGGDTWRKRDAIRRPCGPISRPWPDRCLASVAVARGLGAVVGKKGASPSLRRRHYVLWRLAGQHPQIWQYARGLCFEDLAELIQPAE